MVVTRDSGTGWIAAHCEKEKIPYPDWLDGKTMAELPRHVEMEVIRKSKDFFSFEAETLDDEDTWSKYIIWVIENLNGRWGVSNHHIWIESEDDAVAFKLGCL